MKPIDLERGGLRVLVRLKARTPGEGELRHLEELGLRVERVIRNTIVGSIAKEDLSALASDPSVAAVERDTKLGLHD